MALDRTSAAIDSRKICSPSKIIEKLSLLGGAAKRRRLIQDDVRSRCLTLEPCRASLVVRQQEMAKDFQQALVAVVGAA
jgi:hypothetical protein